MHVKPIDEFRKRLSSQKVCAGVSCATVSPILAEIVGYARYDFMIIDTEMVSINIETIENMVRAAESAGIVTFVKLKDNDPVVISDMLNTGAMGIKVPHCKSGEDARRAMDAAVFPPKGHRGLCPVARVNHYSHGSLAKLIEDTNSKVVVVPLIEDAEGVERIDEIFDVDGIDIVDIGPVDLALSYGVPVNAGYDDPRIAAALDRVAASARARNKHVMTIPFFGRSEVTPSLIKERLTDKGVRVLYWGDSLILRQALAQGLRTLDPERAQSRSQ